MKTTMAQTPPQASLQQRIAQLEDELAQKNRLLEQVRNQAETDLCATEEKFRVFLESIEKGYFEIDLKGNFTFFNDYLCRMMGYSSKELQGLNCREIMTAETLREVLPIMLQVYRSGISEKGFVWELIRKDGVKRQIGSSASLMLDGKGRPKGFRGIASDITDRKFMESRKAQAQKLESIGQLAAGISHEINTPIQYVRENIRFLHEAFDDLCRLLDVHMHLIDLDENVPGRDTWRQKARDMAKEVDMAYLGREIPKAITQSIEGIDRVTDIVRAMKEFSHPGAQTKTLIDINRAIESTITVARNEWKYVADMVVELDRSLPPVPCHAGEVNQVVLNIIVNAAQAIGEIVRQTGEKGRITVQTRRSGNWIEIRVSDTGPGIPEAIRERIFDPFFTTKEVGKGTGQGLALSYSVIAGRHGGAIWFETGGDPATTFVVQLPLDPCDPSPVNGTKNATQ